MKINSAHTKYVPGTSRGPRRAITLLSQVADLQRGERIKELRDARHLTQPVMAERVDVTLRAYQNWEAGGGMKWENAQRLAKTFGVTPDYIMSGEPRETPNLFERNGEPSQLDRIELELAAITRATAELKEAQFEQAARDMEAQRQLEEVAQAIRRLQPPRRR